MTEARALSAMSDRLLVLAAMFTLVFVISGGALIFVEEVGSWRGVDEARDAWGRSFGVLHGARGFLATFALMTLAMLALAWVRELRFGVILEAGGSEGARASRSFALNGMLRRAWGFALPVVLLLVGSGVAVWVLGRVGEEGRLSASVLEGARAFHGGALFGVLQKWLWLAGALNLAVLVVLLCRVRAARLSERGLSAAHIYEDLPQGAALGASAGVLVALAVYAWGGSVYAVSPVMIFAVCWGVAVHLLPVIARSAGWRWLPFLLALAVVAGDVVRGGVSVAAVSVWALGVVFAFFMVLVARVGRRHG